MPVNMNLEEAIVYAKRYPEREVFYIEKWEDEDGEEKYFIEEMYIFRDEAKFEYLQGEYPFWMDQDHRDWSNIYTRHVLLDSPRSCIKGETEDEYRDRKRSLELLVEKIKKESKSIESTITILREEKTRQIKKIWL